MAKAMGGNHLPQPDSCRKQWAEMPVGDGEEYDEELDRLWESSGGGAASEARRQHHHQATAQLAQDRAAAEPMAVDQQPQQQEAAAQEQMKPAQSMATANKGSPDKAAGKLSMDQMLAELDTRPKLPSR